MAIAVDNPPAGIVAQLRAIITTDFWLELEATRVFGGIRNDLVNGSSASFKD